MSKKTFKHHEYKCNNGMCNADWDPNWESCPRCGSKGYTKKEKIQKKKDD